jgi:hypothetical protein
MQVVETDLRTVGMLCPVAHRGVAPPFVAPIRPLCAGQLPLIDVT